MGSLLLNSRKLRTVRKKLLNNNNKINKHPNNKITQLTKNKRKSKRMVKIRIYK
jgi:hypothetical protein